MSINSLNFILRSTSLASGDSLSGVGPIVLFAVSSVVIVAILVVLIDRILQRRSSSGGAMHDREIWWWIAENSPTGVAAFDSEGQLIKMNSRNQDIFALPDHNVLSDWRLFDSYNITDRQKEYLQKGMTVCTRSALDLDAVRERGDYSPTRSGTIYVEVQITPIQVRGQANYILAYTTDLTPQRQAEIAQVESQELLRTAFMASPDAICIMSSQSGRYLDVNEMMAQHLRCSSRDDIIGKTQDELDLWANKDDERLFGEQLSRDGYVLNFDTRFRTSTGTTIPCQISARPSLVKGEPVLVSMIRDTTRIQDIRSRLESSELKFHTAFDATPDGVMIIRLSDGTFAEVNRSLYDGLGFQYEEMIGHTATELNLWPEPMDRDHFYEAVRNNNGHITDYATDFRKRNGKTLPCVISGQVIDLHGEKCIIIVARDDTQRSNYERRLQDALKTAKDANLTKNKFLANISHELRTPLSAVLGFSDLLDNPAINDRDRNDHIETIRRNGQSLLALINDILDLSTIESGMLAIENTTCNLANIINHAVSSRRFQAESNGIEIRVELDNNLPQEIETDPVRLRQILDNLLDNAVHFSATSIQQATQQTDRSRHGFVLISAGMTRTVAGSQKLIRVDVQDGGIALSKQELSEIFEPFPQWQSGSRSGSPQASGLGLAISNRLAQRLNGQISAESVSGVGNTFTLWLDVVDTLESHLPDTGLNIGQQLQQGNVNLADASVRDRADTHCEVDASDALGLSSIRVLLAEDSVDLQRLAKKMLEKIGCEVDLAENGQVAVECALKSEQQKRYDLILMDIQMPVMDGLTAIRQLRTKGWTGPIVALTAHALESDRRASIQAGANRHLSKPVQTSELYQTVLQLTQKNAETVQADDP